jgi:hypothetical protein
MPRRFPTRLFPTPLGPASPAAVSLAVVALALAGLAPAAAGQGAGGPEGREALALTLSQGGPALVVDRRRAVLDEGTSVLRLEGLAGGLVPDSLQVLADHGRVGTVTQFAGAAALPALLDAHVGRSLTLLRRRPDGGEEAVSARLLRARPEPLLEVDGKIMVGLPDRVLFPDLPADLPLDGAVVARIDDAKGGEAAVTLRYLTGGLTWSASHAVTLSADRESLDLVTWATVANASGADWPQAHLALIAGTVHSVDAATPQPKVMMRAYAAAPMMEDAGAAAPEREPVGGYHLYRLGETVDLPRDATVQVALLHASGLKTEVILEDSGSGAPYHGARLTREESHPLQILMLGNPAEGGAGAPLPAGTVRVFATAASGTPVMLGSDHMAPLPVGEEARLMLGESFDVTVERQTTAHERLSKTVTETARAVTLRNGGETAATVRLIEPFPGDWRIVDEGQPHERLDAGRAQWTVAVPAGGTAEVTFRVRTTL